MPLTAREGSALALRRDASMMRFGRDASMLSMARPRSSMSLRLGSLNVPKRSVSQYFSDKALVIVRWFQVYALLLSLAQAWPWPPQFRPYVRWLMFLNGDIAAYELDVSSGVTAISYNQYLIGVFIGIVFLGLGIFGLMMLVIKARLSEGFLEARARAFRVAIYIYDLCIVPVMLHASRAFPCNGTAMGWVPAYTCGGTEHIILGLLGGIAMIVVAIVIPAIAIHVIHRQLVTPLADDHEKMVQLKETEYLVDLDTAWLTSHFYLFSSFKRKAVYHRPFSWMFFSLVAALTGGVRWLSTTYQVIAIFAVLAVYYVYCGVTMPYRMTSTSALLQPLGWVLVIDCVFGVLKSLGVSSALLVDSVLTLWLAFFAALALFMMFIILLTGAIKKCRKRPLWPVTRELASQRSQMRVAMAVKGARELVAQSVRSTKYFVRLDVLEDQIVFVNRVYDDAKNEKDPLTISLLDALEDLVNVYNAHANVSLLPNPELEAELPNLRGRLEERARKMALYPPAVRTFLLGTLAVSHLIGHRKLAPLRLVKLVFEDMTRLHNVSDQKFYQVHEVVRPDAEVPKQPNLQQKTFWARYISAKDAANSAHVGEFHLCQLASGDAGVSRDGIHIPLQTGRGMLYLFSPIEIVCQVVEGDSVLGAASSRPMGPYVPPIPRPTTADTSLPWEDDVDDDEYDELLARFDDDPLFRTRMGAIRARTFSRVGSQALSRTGSVVSSVAASQQLRPFARERRRSMALGVGDDEFGRRDSLSSTMNSAYGSAFPSGVPSRRTSPSNSANTTRPPSASGVRNSGAPSRSEFQRLLHQRLNGASRPSPIAAPVSAPTDSGSSLDSPMVPPPALLIDESPSPRLTRQQQLPRPPASDYSALSDDESDDGDDYETSIARLRPAARRASDSSEAPLPRDGDSALSSTDDAQSMRGSVHSLGPRGPLSAGVASSSTDRLPPRPASAQQHARHNMPPRSPSLPNVSSDADQAGAISAAVAASGVVRSPSSVSASSGPQPAGATTSARALPPRVSFSLEGASTLGVPPPRRGSAGARSPSLLDDDVLGGGDDADDLLDSIDASVAALTSAPGPAADAPPADAPTAFDVMAQQQEQLRREQEAEEERVAEQKRRERQEEEQRRAEQQRREREEQQRREREEQQRREREELQRRELEEKQRRELEEKQRREAAAAAAQPPAPSPAPAAASSSLTPPPAAGAPSHSPRPPRPQRPADTAPAAATASSDNDAELAELLARASSLPKTTELAELVRIKDALKIRVKMFQDEFEAKHGHAPKGAEVPSNVAKAYQSYRTLTTLVQTREKAAAAAAAAAAASDAPPAAAAPAAATAAAADSVPDAPADDDADDVEAFVRRVPRLVDTAQGLISSGVTPATHRSSVKCFNELKKAFEKVNDASLKLPRERLPTANELFDVLKDLKAAIGQRQR